MTAAERHNPYNLRYDPAEIDSKWRARWDADRLYEADTNDPRPKWYALTMFPYTSGDLHVGHWYAEAPADAHARYMRMRGYNVMHPMGFDSFGLPAENAAIQRGIHPQKWTLDNVERMRGQLKTIGAGYDWRRELITCMPEYYTWNQYFFLKLFEKGIAYRAMAPVNWCEQDQTTLAREQVMPDGTCERCGTAVYQRDLEQWFFRITDYAEELLDNSGIDWPERINLMQINWIGRSEGAEISFGLDVPGVDETELRVFTTRPDTAYGVTFMVLAPEHPLVPALTTADNRARVEEYVAQARRLTEIERLSTEKEKTGVPLGTYCINRLNGQRVAIWIADYALATYGTGAVMGVPGHDQRDFEFAGRYVIPVEVVISPPDWDGSPLSKAYLGEGPMVNSGPFDGAPNEDGKAAVVRYLQEQQWGDATVSYRIRDWLVSRQRYWGTPIPIIYCPNCGIVPVPEDQLPVVLPEDADFRPTGESPLRYHDGFRKTACPQCGNADAERETDTMDTFVDSAWYQFRYTSPDSGFDAPFDPEQIRQWAPVDLYTGGAEHAVMHLLYARFFTKALRDLGMLDFDEPFLRLFNQGIILGEDHEKMSKSRGNVVNPDEQTSLLGADAVRAYLMFVGPWEQGGAWSTQAIRGIPRWFNRIWDLAELRNRPAGEPANSALAAELVRETHRTIQKATEDIEAFQFNTMIASLMTLTNTLARPDLNDATVTSPEWRAAFDALLLLAAPIAPHLTEELWERTGHDYSIHQQSWPEYDAALTRTEEITLIVQVDGKLRDRLTVAADVSQEQAQEAALASGKVQAALAGSSPARVVYVPGRLVNVVTG